MKITCSSDINSALRLGGMSRCMFPQHCTAIIIALVLAGCVSYPPSELVMSPSECRHYGVDVTDDDTITGTVVHSQAGSLGLAYRECGENTAGCAKGVEQTWPSASHRYEIFYTNHDEARHEFCHAAYEESGHTVESVIAMAQGYYL
jgi:hypothetical protein